MKPKEINNSLLLIILQTKKWKHEDVMSGLLAYRITTNFYGFTKRQAIYYVKYVTPEKLIRLETSCLAQKIGITCFNGHYYEDVNIA